MREASFPDANRLVFSEKVNTSENALVAYSHSFEEIYWHLQYFEETNNMNIILRQ